MTTFEYASGLANGVPLQVLGMLAAIGASGFVAWRAVAIAKWLTLAALALVPTNFLLASSAVLAGVLTFGYGIGNMADKHEQKVAANRQRNEAIASRETAERYMWQVDRSGKLFNTNALPAVPPIEVVSTKEDCLMMIGGAAIAIIAAVFGWPAGGKKELPGTTIPVPPIVSPLGIAQIKITQDWNCHALGTGILTYDKEKRQLFHVDAHTKARTALTEPV